MGGWVRRRRKKERETEERDKDDVVDERKDEKTEEGRGWLVEARERTRAESASEGKKRKREGRVVSPSPLPLVRRSGGRTDGKAAVGRKTERLYPAQRPGREGRGGGETLLTPPSIQDGVGSGSPRH